MLNNLNFNPNNNNNPTFVPTQNDTMIPVPSGNFLEIQSTNPPQTDTYITNQVPKSSNKKTPLWLRALGSALLTAGIILGVGYTTTKLGITPLISNTKGLYNSRTTEIEDKCKDKIGGIKGIMTLNSHCKENSLTLIPKNHQQLVVCLDKKEAKGIETLTKSTFKDNIIYGGELELKQIKDLDKLQKYVEKIAKEIKKKDNLENITLASKESRCANMINAVLKAHSEDKQASTYDFVEGGIPSYYFWGKDGLTSGKLDDAIWHGWCDGFGLEYKKPSDSSKQDKEEEIKPEEAEKENTPTKEAHKTTIKDKEIKEEKEIEKNQKEIEEKKKSDWDEFKEGMSQCFKVIKRAGNRCWESIKTHINNLKK